MSNPLFSFILPAYKAQFLKESIQSILSQTFRDFELIIVNDASPDNIWDIVSTFTDQRIKYFENRQNIGGKNLTAQWNYCLSLATGDYVILATDDDTYKPNFLCTFAPLILQYPNVDIFRARILSINSKGEIIHLDSCLKTHLSQKELLYQYMTTGISGGIPQNIFKRETLLTKGGFVQFPCAWGSDDATVLMMAEKGIISSQEILVCFRWSNINISSIRTSQISTAKISARLQLFNWINNLIPNLSHSGDDIDIYFDHYIRTNLTNFFKSFILRELTQYYSLKAFYLLYTSRMFSFKDKLSLLFHFLKKKLHL